MNIKGKKQRSLLIMNMFYMNKNSVAYNKPIDYKAYSLT